MQPLMNLARHQNDSATSKLGQLNRQHESVLQQLAELLEYRKDYQARLQEASRNGMCLAELQNFQKFIERLDEAIVQQTRQVECSKTSVQAGCNEFNNAQRNLKSFDMLQQRHIEEQKKAAMQAEQKALDEHSGRYAASKIMNTENQ